MGRRVLVVDDDPATRRLVASILDEAGYDTQTAVDGEHAVRSVIALRPDLVILDIHVPEKDMAIRFAQLYRDRVGADDRAPIIALSGASDLEEVGQQLGATAFLKKPFEMDELLRLVAKHLPQPVEDPDPALAPDGPAETEGSTAPSVADPGTALA